jgi:gliding motility-associated-like protein
LQHFETYIDSGGVSPQNNPYFYKIVAVDSCQNQYTAPYGETVSLQGILYEYYVAQLQWNSFYLQNATVLYYNLYRDFGTGYQLIQTFQPGVNLYYDSLQNFLNEKGTFCYKIEAVYYLNLPAPSNYHDTLSSFSNVVCVIHRPIIYIPNAFSPGSNVNSNTTFKPTIIYGDPQGYTMTIFNRWGGIVFESNNLALGWDGTDHGKEATMGGYGYIIQFTADDGVLIQKQGIVMLVR